MSRHLTTPTSSLLRRAIKDFALLGSLQENPLSATIIVVAMNTMPLQIIVFATTNVVAGQGIAKNKGNDYRHCGSSSYYNDLFSHHKYVVAK